MPNFTRGKSFTSTEELTSTKLHTLIEDAAIGVTAITSLTALTDPVADTDTLPIADVSATAIRKVTASNFLKKNASAIFDAGTTRVTGVATPVSASDATTKSYVDAIAVVSGNLPQVTSGNNGSVLTVSGGSWSTAASDAIGTGQIQSLAVTGAKMENSGVTAGVYGAATTTPQITIDAKGRVTGAIGLNSITSDLSVTTAKLVDSSVTTAKIYDGSVTIAKIADANITTAKIADANITTAKIADSAITTAKIAASAVGTASIDNSSVTAAKVDTTGVAVLGTAQEYTRTHNFNCTTLTDGSSISWDLSQNQVAKVTLAGNRTIAAPTNAVEGATYVLVLIQDATGSRTVTWNAAYKFPSGTAPTLTTTASRADVVTFICIGSVLYGAYTLNFVTT